MENEREKQVYLAKLSEQTERYDGTFWISGSLCLLNHFVYVSEKSDLLLLRSNI